MKQLKEGITGLPVDYAQLALSRAGFSVGAIDGVFGPVTRKATVAFQKSEKITAQC